MGYDIEEARKAGVSDSEIADTLAPRMNYDLEGARKAGVSDTDIANTLASKFNTTPGGAATGNPLIQRYGEKALRSGGDFGGTAAIGGAAALGGALGAASKEILTGAGNVIGSFPYPITRTVGGFLKGAGQVIGAGGRAAPTVAGALSGVGGETAGQVAEAAGAGPVTAEAARIVGGGLTPETLTLSKQLLTTYVTKPALSFASHLKKQMAKAILGKLDDGKQLLSEAEQKFLDAEIAALRGGAKSNEPLENVGSIMGAEGEKLLNEADWRMMSAQFNRAGIRQPGQPPRELADIGGDLRETIAKRNEAALQARSRQYTENEKIRDAVVAFREKAGQYVNSLPEYQNLISSLQSELDNSVAMKRSPSVQAAYQKIISELSDPEKPISFQALDDVRRKLGDAFRGKPAEGYDALGESLAKDLYGKVSEIQRKYAGASQAKLLDEYASSTKGLEQFSSKYGKKATALDQYRDEQYATDPSALPASYFKTRASVQALKSLTGDEKQVNSAALEYVNRQLAGKDAESVRKWMSANSDWLSEVRPVQALTNIYATRLEGAERSLRNAEEFAKEAARDPMVLSRKSLPAQRAIDLIKSGDTEIWSRVIPAIQQSPQAKTQMMGAVRQVLGDQATSKNTIDLFSRNIRPFLEQAKITNKAELDFIAQRLESIQKMQIPDPEKLGIMKRVLLQAASGWTASAGARAGEKTYEWSREMVVPQ